MTVRVGETFGPHPDTKKLYYAYSLSPAAFYVAFVTVFLVTILSFATRDPFLSFVVGPLLVVLPVLLGVGLYWIPKYISSVKYRLESDRIVFERGVWWKRKSIVPYNRITNVDVVQGPLSRHFGLGRVSIQTAGYTGASGGSAGNAEISIFGVKDYDEIKDTVLAMAMRTRPMSVEAASERSAHTVEEVILEELKGIRKEIKDLAGESRSRP